MGYLLVYDVIKPSKDDEEKMILWHKKCDKLMKVCAPIMIICGVLLLIMEFTGL